MDFTKLSTWVKTIAATITVIIGIIGTLRGWWSDVGNYFVSSNEQTKREVVLNNLADDIISNKDIPTTITSAYIVFKNEINRLDSSRQSEINGLTEVVDSVSFDVMQLNNLAWANMKRYQPIDSCSNSGCGPCKYYFRKNIRGTIFYRLRGESHMYSITWNATVGAYEYTDDEDKKVYLKHCWERNN